MKKIFYIDKFFPDDLYYQFSSLSLSCDYQDTNNSKRSFCSNPIILMNENLHQRFIEHVKDILNINIIECSLSFYKRKNSKFNPHIDGFPLHILVYLWGDKCDLKNGTFFMNDNQQIILQTANVPNSAVVFDGNYIHGSIQAEFNVEDRGWRYSLNCFVKKYN